MWAFLSHLPVAEVSLSVKGWWEGCEEQTERALSTSVTNIREQSSWLPVHADQEYVLQVSLQRLNAGRQRVRIHTCTISASMTCCTLARFPHMLEHLDIYRLDLQ